MSVCVVLSYLRVSSPALANTQSSLFQIFNTLVRTSPEARERVLQYFATVVRLNVKRAGMQVRFPHSTLLVSSFYYWNCCQC